MKLYSILIFLSFPLLIFSQNIGININNPSEILHIQDSSSTKLLLKTNNGTSFLTTDSPTNSGLLFRASGLDMANIFYSPSSNSLSTMVGLNGWTLESNGDFRVKERIYSLNDLRLDATESITIEANGAVIKIDPQGNIEIQGKSINISAEDDLNILANNINIEAQNAMQLTSGSEANITAGGSLEVSSGNDMNHFVVGDFNVESNNLALSVSKASNITSGTGLAITSQDLSIISNQSANFAAANNINIATGDDFDLTIGRNYGLNVAKDYNLTILQNYDLNALSINSQASSTMNILGSLIKFNNGNIGFAKVGDSVEVGGKIGSITSGSTTVLGN